MLPNVTTATALTCKVLVAESVKLPSVEVSEPLVPAPGLM
jgi:hypothetical protein